MFPERPDCSDIKGRLDIRYATLSGRHVIVELKRYAVQLDADELAEQGLKYYEALNDILDKELAPELRHDGDIEIVFVLGDRPAAKGNGRLSAGEYYAGRFAPFYGRVVLYDQLIANANNQYCEYLEASEKVSTLNELLKAFEPQQDTSSSLTAQAQSKA